MKKIFSLITLLTVLSACSKVEVGYVGVKVDKYGSERGVNTELLEPGSYFTGWNTDVHGYPTFTKMDKWTKSSAEGKPIDESLSFQIGGGILVNTDIGIAYHIEKSNVIKVFQKYRQPIAEVSDNALRNLVRDELNRAGVKYDVEALQGKGKIDLMNEVTASVQASSLVLGITVESVSFINEMRYPAAIVEAMNAKIHATQVAMQIENEVRQTRATSEKLIVQADAQVKVAQAEAQAMELRGKAMQANPNLLELKKLEVQQAAISKWNGALPAQMVPGSALPFINLSK